MYLLFIIQCSAEHCQKYNYFSESILLLLTIHVVVIIKALLTLTNDSLAY